jgi:hypothetical protein
LFKAIRHWNQDWHDGCDGFFSNRTNADNKLGNSIERIFMNEFLLLALVVVYMVISYRPASSAARNDHQRQNASRGPRGAEDH